MQSNNADLIATALRGPQGPSDSGYYTGTIVAWDDTNGLNTVMVNGVPLANLKVVQQGVGVPYAVGDVVMIARKQTQYFILGKVTTPGSGSNSLKTDTVATDEGTASTTYTDLATVGPTVTAVIGTSQRCLVIANVEITCAGFANPAQYIGGDCTFQVTGASNLPATTIALYSSMTNNCWAIPSGTGPQVGFRTSVGTSVVLTSAIGLNSGLNTFQMKYKSRMASPTCGFTGRTLTVIPL